ncbi:hypothetical protein CTAYLR_000177 [Chrysophaeum taylorii]|uniref:Histidine phosphatase family protein n=1 Tax=Chrysophaeum taylorii TaxID=2483200 RepID=A0AAD7UF19_9STRA|nr:hypothetical protein CTAYLR_000177 [Chrysophaeum taylorii]
MLSSADTNATDKSSVVSKPDERAWKRVTFLRHGESEANVSHLKGIRRRDPRLRDCFLTRRGVEQARAVGIHAQVEPELVVASPLTRALATTLLLGFDCPIVVHAGIRELGSSVPENEPRSLQELRRDRRLTCFPRFGDIDFVLLGPNWPRGGDGIESFEGWLKARPETTVWVVAHCNVIFHLLNGQVDRVPNCYPLPCVLNGVGFQLIDAALDPDASAADFTVEETSAAHKER